jgi:invasion protein IalB
MNYRNQTGERIAGRTMNMALTLASGILALGLASTAVLAQAQPAAKAAPKGAAPAAAPAAAAAPAQPQTFWVKLCEKAQVGVPDKDGKPVPQEKNICLVHHERLDGNSGMVIVSAALRNVEGSEKQHLMVMVPLAIGVAIPPGLRAAVYDKDTWAKAQKNEKIDDKLLKPVDLKYTLCHPSGCTAEIEATKELVDALKTGGGLVVLAMNGAAQPVPFSIPLDGFAAAIAGAPVDNKIYSTERTRFFQELRQRQEEAYQKAVEAQKTQERLAPKPGELAPAPLTPAKKP